MKKTIKVHKTNDFLNILATFNTRANYLCRKDYDTQTNRSHIWYFSENIRCPSTDILAVQSLTRGGAVRKAL